ncbi:tetratricopeptide repeat protein [Halomicrococcus sp. NG-SE-24]|uniref:tetratricopeptide repeat protein n=1 Tax=Halomicrococcus sp. NG-SE-24 TaxID=3436928 RepID=UPI003D95E760
MSVNSLEMVPALPVSASTASCSLLLQLDFLERILSDPLGQIVTALVVIGGTILAAIQSEIIKGYLVNGGKRVRFYSERNRRRDEIHHLVGVRVSNILWKGVFQYLGNDPVTEMKKLSKEDGFTWLSTTEIEDGELDQQKCWQRPFSFREIHEGFAIDRERERHGSRENFSEVLLNELDDGALAFVGHPGSGKSTMCKTIAIRWYDQDDLGPVFYRASGMEEDISKSAVFRERIENGKRIGPVLIVVEDTVRRDAAPIFETMLEYRNDEDVSFLLDAHEHEWNFKSFEDVLQTLVERPDTTRWRELIDLQNDVELHDVPPIDIREVERMIERFEKVTGREVREDPQQILQRIRLEKEDVSAGGHRSDMWPSPMLLLSYHFPIGRGESGGGEPSSSLKGDEELTSALECNVNEVLEMFENADTKALDIESNNLFQEVSLLVNILNASNIGVYEELLYALADTKEEYDAIEICIAELDGKVLFGRSSGTHYWSNHPLWSELYLERFLVRNSDRDRERWARARFERCVNALFRVVDEDSRREQIQRELGQTTNEFRQIEEDPTERADAYVEKIFKLGTARPKLTPLFTTSEYSGIRVPEACSSWTRAYCSIWRLRMYQLRSEYPKAEKEAEAFRDTGLEVGVDERKVELEYQRNLGNVASRQETYERAHSHYKRSLEISQELDDRRAEAKALNNLGNVTHNQCDYEDALSYYKESLDIKQDLNDRRGEAATLNNLGTVVSDQDDYESALSHYQKSLEISQDLGDRSSEAATLHNLGSLASDQDDHEDALSYYEESLKIERDLGDRYGEAKTLNNLGDVARKQYNYENALLYYEKSLNISRKIGAIWVILNSIDNLVSTCRCLEDKENAIQWCRTALSIIDESDIDLTDERTMFEGYLNELESSEEDGQ